jgi:hypothetical protein
LKKKGLGKHQWFYNLSLPNPYPSVYCFASKDLLGLVKQKKTLFFKSAVVTPGQWFFFGKKMKFLEVKM